MLCDPTSTLWLCSDTALALIFVEYRALQAAIDRSTQQISDHFEFTGELVLPGCLEFSSKSLSTISDIDQFLDAFYIG